MFLLPIYSELLLQHLMQLVSQLGRAALGEVRYRLLLLVLVLAPVDAGTGRHRGLYGSALILEVGPNGGNAPHHGPHLTLRHLQVTLPGLPTIMVAPEDLDSQTRDLIYDSVEMTMNNWPIMV